MRLSRREQYELAPRIVAARVLQDRGTQIWITQAEGETSAEITLVEGSLNVVWNDDVEAVCVGRAVGPDDQDEAWWLEGLAHQDDDGLYRRDDGGELVGDGSLEDALELALEEGHYPDLIDEETGRIEAALEASREKKT